MKIVIDADQTVYACGFATEGEDLSHTLGNVKTAMKRIISDNAAGSVPEVVIYLGGEGNFRENLAVTKGYKSSRPTRKPTAYDDIRRYLIDTWGAKLVDGMEADDQTSIDCYTAYMEAGRDPAKCTTIISSPDKDLKNTPGWHYNPRTRERYWVSERQATRHFAYQLLMGDRVDDIVGLPSLDDVSKAMFDIPKNRVGLGKATAKGVLSRSWSWRRGLVDVFTCYLNWGHSVGMSEAQTKEYLLEQAQLLWMVREVDEFGDPQIFQFTGTMEKLYEIARRRWTEDCLRSGREEEGSGESSEGSIGQEESSVQGSD